MVSEGSRILGGLLANDDWLPEFAAVPDPTIYRQYLLHCDPLERFSIVSFVWGPGQRTPVHDHTVWGLIGVLRGEEMSRRYIESAEGHIAPAGEARYRPGAIDVVSPARGDIHEVISVHEHGPSVSIHVYGANIGAVRRHVFDIKNGGRKQFISGYSSPVVPNLWSRPLSR